jgi:hypothetical protein
MPQQSPRMQAPDLPYLPPPPPPGNVLALFRWSLAVLNASTGRDRAAIRRHQAAPGGGESLGTVAIAIGADLAMFAAKARHERDEPSRLIKTVFAPRESRPNLVTRRKK